MVTQRCCPGPKARTNSAVEGRPTGWQGWLQPHSGLDADSLTPPPRVRPPRMAALRSCRRLNCERRPNPPSPGPRRFVNLRGGQDPRDKPTRAPRPGRRPTHCGTAEPRRGCGTQHGAQSPAILLQAVRSVQQGAHEEGGSENGEALTLVLKSIHASAKRGALTTWACGVTPAAVYRSTGVSPRKLTEKNVIVTLQSKPVVKIRTLALKKQRLLQKMQETTEPSCSNGA